jgi:NAD(P)-dependent dehydrogenase (short-subunit alcohol dehydrogenase family)
VRLKGKIGIVVGAGQTPGETIGNGRAERDKRVPLRGKMGTAWDVAHAALFLHSDDSAFITGVALAVDGGQSARIG